MNGLRRIRKEAPSMAVVRSRSSSEATPAVLDCHAAASAAELADHHRIRHAVFVTEQGIFEDSDIDELDANADTYRVLGFVDGCPSGAVRFYPIPAEQPGESLWKGDRLAVLHEHRRAGLGVPLVRYAVTTAGSLGGDRMIAYIQPDNVVFFQRLG